MSKFKAGNRVEWYSTDGKWEGPYAVAQDGKAYRVGGLIDFSDPPERYRLVESKESDNVNNPSHYGQGKIECIYYISDFLTKEEYIGYLRGNIAKYLHRWRYKNGIEDLKKANWYLDRLMWEIEGDNN